VDAGITYTQTGTWFRDAWVDKTYRRDCSGLVSMAWHLGESYVTGDFQGSSPYWTRLASRDQLAPGDAIVRNRHMELFSH
jgi:cell wall-associated NlpC family hydrolase